jgi:hypothetical protein
MPKPTTVFVGLDAHRGFIPVARAEAHVRRWRCAAPSSRKALGEPLPFDNGATTGG